MTRERQQEEFADVRFAIPESIRRAAQHAGVQPMTSLADMSRDASESNRLHIAFQHQVNAAIEQRIRSDPDYNAEKYPNTDKFFNEKE